MTRMMPGVDLRRRRRWPTTLATMSSRTSGLANWPTRIARRDRPPCSSIAFGPSARRRAAAAADVRPSAMAGRAAGTLIPSINSSLRSPRRPPAGRPFANDAAHRWRERRPNVERTRQGSDRRKVIVSLNDDRIERELRPLWLPAHPALASRGRAGRPSKAPTRWRTAQRGPRGVILAPCRRPDRSVTALGLRGRGPMKSVTELVPLAIGIAIVGVVTWILLDRNVGLGPWLLAALLFAHGWVPPDVRLPAAGARHRDGRRDRATRSTWHGHGR